MLIRQIRRIRPIGLIALLTLVAWPARAQWVTQTLSLKAGWNAVYLHVDASHDSLDNVMSADSGNPIEEVWMWAPPVSTVQFVTSPQDPLPDSGQWRYWARSSGTATLQRLVGNHAYLVRVASGTPTYSWNLKGKPVAPSYNWTTTGLNFIGFPTAPGSGPTWEDFLAQAPQLQMNAEVFRYQGGDLGATNPVRLLAFRSQQVVRGQAYWMRAGTVFNRYFAPFELEMTGAAGVSFGESLSASSFRLRNLTASNLTVTLGLVASEDPPAGQTNIAGVPPLLLRGELDKATLGYAYTNLTTSASRQVTLAPRGQVGSDVEVVLGLNRTAMNGGEGALWAAVLRLTDSMGFSRVDMPVTARVASSAGLWVGDAEVVNVSSYLPALERAATGSQVPNVTLPDGVTPEMLDTDPVKNVQRPFPVRLIVHNPGPGSQAKLLQRVFYGSDTSSNLVVSTSEASLDPAQLARARRISSSLIPWTSQNQPWALSGRLGQDAEMTVTVDIPFDEHAANPFLHTFHPDHDGKDATFRTQLPVGAESYGLRRTITLKVKPPSSNVFEVGSRQSIRGVYDETLEIIGLARAGGTHDKRVFKVAGTFSLTRISPVPVLTTP